MVCSTREGRVRGVDVTMRTRAAVLWVVVAVAVSTSILLYLLRPGALEEALAGEMEGEPLTSAAVLLLAVLVGVPLMMAVVTLLVNGRANRYVNLVVAVLFGAFGAFASTSEAMGGDFDAHVLMVVLATLATFLVAGLSLVGLRAPASGTPSSRA